MAALICNSFGECCREVCMLPCRVMRSIGQCLQAVHTPPMMLYALAVVGTNVMPMIYTWSVQHEYGKPALFFTNSSDYNINATCHEAVRWLWINSIFCALHIVAAIYIVCRVRARNIAELPNNNNDPSCYYCDFCFREGEGPASTVKRVQHVTCYDPIFALYIFVMGGFIYWIVRGIRRILPNLSFAAANNYPCPSLQYPAVFESLRWSILFFTLGTVTFALSLCCLRGRRRVYHKNATGRGPFPLPK